jgi:hypothetical protein
MARSRAKAHHIIERLIEPRLVARLLAHCTITGDDALDVIADAIELHLEEAEDSAERTMLEEIAAAGYAPVTSDVAP